MAVLYAAVVVFSLVGCDLPPAENSSNSTDGNAVSLPEEWIFNIRQPQKQVDITEDETATIDKIDVEHLLAGETYEYTFSSSEEITAILSWYKSLDLEAATFSEGEERPNERDGSEVESYTIYYKDDMQNKFWYYSGDGYIYAVTDDIWYRVIN